MEKNYNDLNVNTVLLHLPPKELQRLVFNRLPQKSLLAARCVSKLWKDLIDSTLDFHLELSDSTLPYVESFGESRQVSSLSTTAFQGPYPSNGLQIRTKMVRVTVGVLDGNENFQEYRRRSRQNPRKNIGLTYHNLRGIMHDFYYVGKFQIASLAVKSFTKPQQQLLSRVYLPNVKEMIITFFDGGFHQLLPYMKNYFPKLESVNIANVAESRNDRPLLYSWIFGFVGRHRKTLTEVTLILPEGMIDDRGSGGGGGGGGRGGNHNLFSLLPGMNIRKDLRRDLKMPQHTYLDVKHRLENFTQLKKLIWDTGMLEGQRRYDLGTTLLISQTMLVELHIDNLHLKDLPLWGHMDKLLEKISPTLETLSLGGCFCGPPSALLGVYVFSCSWLKNCKRLKQLEMVICGISVESIEDLPFEQLLYLNLGHMLIQDQIEFICRHGKNLETWVVPQRGCLVNILVAKVTSYLFQCMLHLPRLKILNLFSACAEATEILEYVQEQPGIRKCGRMCIMEQERNGDIRFHIDRQLFKRDHSQLDGFMEENRVNPVDQMNGEDLVEYFIRNIIAGRLIENHEVELLFRRDENGEDAQANEQFELGGLHHLFLP